MALRDTLQYDDLPASTIAFSDGCHFSLGTITVHERKDDWVGISAFCPCGRRVLKTDVNHVADLHVFELRMVSLCSLCGTRTFVHTGAEGSGGCSSSRDRSTHNFETNSYTQ